MWLVGAGPGDPGLLTLKGLRAIEACDVLVHDALVSDEILALAPARCERIDVGKRAGAHALAQAEINALLVRLALEGRLVCRLKGGDAFVFGRGGEEVRALHDAGVRFEIVPGVSSAIAVPAYAGIPVTHRDHNASFAVATGHQDPTKDAGRLDFAGLANPHATTVFLMALGRLEEIAAELIAHRLPPETPVAVVSEGTTPRQRTVVATIATVAAEVKRARLPSPATVIVGTVVSEREIGRWFEQTLLFGSSIFRNEGASVNRIGEATAS